MLLSVNMAPQNQQERVAQWSGLASCGIQHCLVGKAKTQRGQPISWKALHHPNATIQQQHGKSEMQKVVQEFKVVQEQLLEDQEHDNEVIQKQQKEKYQYDVNGIQEPNYPEEQHDLQSLHKQEGHQEEQHGLQSLHKQEKHQEEHYIPAQEQEIDIVTVQEQEHCEQELDLSTVKEQGQVQEREYGLKKVQRMEYLQDHRQYSNIVKKLQQPETQKDLCLEKNEELQEQEHLNVKVQGNLRNEKEFLQIPSEKQENLKLEQTHQHLHVEPHLIIRGVEEQQLQQEHQQEFRKVKLQPLKKGEQKQYQYQDEVSVPDNCVGPDQLQPKFVKVLHTLQPMKPCTYQQEYQNEYINILPENRAVKSADKRKACSEDKQDRRKAVRSSFGQDVQLQGFILYPVFAEGKDNPFEDVEDHHLDKEKLESSDDYHFENKNQKGFSVNCMGTKPFDGLEQRDVMKVSEELDFCSEKNFMLKVLGRSDKKHLLPKRVQELKNGDSYKRNFSTTEIKQESLGELKAKFENQKDALAQKSRDLKGFNTRPFNPKDTEIQKAKLLDPQINKELDCQKDLHSNSPRIKTTEDQLCKHSNKELKAPAVDDKEQCTSWGSALVKCLKELQARTSRRHILHEFGHSGSCMVASCRPSCRLFRRLRHHVVNAQHRCSLFHLYTTLLHEHVSVCSSPTCGLRACPAIRANRRVHTPAASPTNATPCVTSAQVEIANKM